MPDLYQAASRKPESKAHTMEVLQTFVKTSATAISAYCGVWIVSQMSD